MLFRSLTVSSDRRKRLEPLVEGDEVGPVLNILRAHCQEELELLVELEVRVGDVVANQEIFLAKNLGDLGVTLLSLER